MLFIDESIARMHASAVAVAAAVAASMTLTVCYSKAMSFETFCILDTHAFNGNRSESEV